MSYVDRTVTCVDCGVEFIHSAADQEFYAQKGFVSDPKRCSSCFSRSLTADLVVPSRRAASDTLLASTMDTNICISENLSNCCP